MKKRIISFLLAVVIGLLILPSEIIKAEAKYVSQYAPYAEIKYEYDTRVHVGTIRYISQLTGNKYFDWNYWPADPFGSYAKPGSECYTASISMALSYIGVDKTPFDILHYNEGQTGYAATKEYAAQWGGSVTRVFSSNGLDEAVQKYVDGNGKISPVIIHLNVGASYQDNDPGHFIAIIGKVDDGVYQIADPADSSPFNLSIKNGKTTYKGIANTILDYTQYTNPNACNHTAETGKSEFVDNAIACGVCSLCGYVYDWESTFNSADAGTYKLINRDYVPRTLPYTNSPTVGFCIPLESVPVEGSYTNAYGNKWYVFSYGGQRCFAYEDRMELISQAPIIVTCTNFSPANNAVLEKKSYPVKGTVKSNYPLKSIEGYLDGAKFATWTASNQTTTTVELRNTAINDNLKFSSLADEKHTIVLKAYGFDSDTPVQFHSSNFTIGASSQPTPSQTVTCTNFSPANNAVLEKKSYNVTGTVTSNLPLKSIEGYLDGAKFATWTASNQTTTTVELRNTVINTNLKFSSLSNGKHTVVLKAYGFNSDTPIEFHSSVFSIGHTCSYVIEYEYIHPHKEYNRCYGCGYTEYTGNILNNVSYCSTCNERYTVEYNANGGTGAPASQIKSNGIALCFHLKDRQDPDIPF